MIFPLSFQVVRVPFLSPIIKSVKVSQQKVCARVRTFLPEFSSSNECLLPTKKTNIEKYIYLYSSSDLLINSGGGGGEGLTTRKL